MANFSLQELAEACQGELIGENTTVSGISTDSRKLAINDLYVALTGERFDGHAFLVEVKALGAAAAVVSKSGDGEPTNMPLVKVADTQLALGRIAARNRSAFTGPVIALTGSSGKTSCKEMIASILNECGDVLATLGNLNNEIGVPQTLLGLEPHHDFAVIEMGAAKSGDIAYLCDFARPNITLVTNAQPAHVQGFGSLEGVAKTKGEIFEQLSQTGIAIVNRDDKFFPLWKSMIASRTYYSFGFSEDADFRAIDIQGSDFTLVCPAGEARVALNLTGKHMVANALAAAAASFAAGADINEIVCGLQKVTSSAGRLHSLMFGQVELIDDTYNANPGSVKAAIDVLANKSGDRVLVLGDMAELGENSAAMHVEVGQFARGKLDHLYAVGTHAQNVVEGFGAGQAFADKETLQRALLQKLPEQGAVLVKGSRSAGMESIIKFLAGELG